MTPTLDEMHAMYCQALGRITGISPEGVSERVGPWLCIDAGLGVSRFNVAVPVEPVDRPREQVREANNWFAGRGLNCRLDLRGSTDGAALAAAMVDGFTFWNRQPAMSLHPLPVGDDRPTGLEIRDASSASDVERYCEVDREEFADQEFQAAMANHAARLPGVTLHLGLVDGRPVARSMSMTNGPLVGVYNVYVAPSQRNRGFGAEMTMAAVERGRRAGAVAACLESTVEAFALYERLGFRRVDDYVIVGTDAPVFL